MTTGQYELFIQMLIEQIGRLEHANEQLRKTPQRAPDGKFQKAISPKEYYQYLIKCRDGTTRKRSRDGKFLPSRSKK